METEVVSRFADVMETLRFLFACGACFMVGYMFRAWRDS